MSSKLWFAQGWFFFVPYFLIYAFSLLLNLPVSIGTWLFQALHLATFALFLKFVGSEFRLTTRSEQEALGSELLFWGGLFLLLLLPGAYLEYPSDSWEHFRRIYNWQGVGLFRESVIRERFAYFWGWSLLGWVPISHRVFALGLYAAFWQWILFFQFYLFFRRFGVEKNWAKLSVAGVMLLFGSNVFSLRYYALSSTPLAYLLYLRGLIIAANFLEGKGRKQALVLPFLFGMIAWSHFQESIFLILGALVLVLLRISRNHSKQVIFWGSVFLVLSFAVGIGLRNNHIEWYAPLGPESISRLGSFKLWKLQSPYFETWGVHGLVSLGFSILFFRKYRELCVLSWVGIFLLLFPPSALLIAQNIKNPYDSYRILYLFPISTMLVLGIKEFFMRDFWKDLGGKIGDGSLFFRRNALWISLGVLLLFSAIPSFPFRGRLFFQFYKSPESRSLSALHQTASWFQDQGLARRDCVLTDDVTRFVLTTHLGWPFHAQRLLPHPYIRNATQAHTLYELISGKKACALLVADPAKLPPPAPSKIAQLSRHWEEEKYTLSWNYDPETTLSESDKLLARGWTKTEVPPYYFLYQPSTK